VVLDPVHENDTHAREGIVIQLADGLPGHLLPGEFLLLQWAALCIQKIRDGFHCSSSCFPGPRRSGPTDASSAKATRRVACVIAGGDRRSYLLTGAQNRSSGIVTALDCEESGGGLVS